MPSRIPSFVFDTNSTSLGPGSDVNTTLQRAATSAGEFPRAAPFSSNGLVISSLENNSGGDPIEGVLVQLLNEDRTTIDSDITDSGGRFSIVDVPRQSSILYVQHPDNNTVEILLVPGAHSQIVVTLEPVSYTHLTLPTKD